MHRRAACRVLLGLVAAAALGCGRGEPEPPTQLPPNRFPKAPTKPKPKEGRRDAPG